MANWKKSPDFGRAAPDEEGLYAIYLDGRLAYIGQTLSLKYRLNAHSLGHAQSIGTWKGQVFGSASVKICLHSSKFSRRINRERRLIKRLSPYLNIASAGSAKARDIVMNTRSGMHLEYG